MTLSGLERHVVLNLLCIKKLIKSCAAILQGGCDMEDSPSPERAAVVGCRND